MPKAILFDVKRCIACRACQVSCKRWNNTKGEKTTLNADPITEWTNPLELNAETWTIIRFVKIGSGDDFKWRFVTRRCAHCIDPACVSACPVNALYKTEEGPVLYDSKRCIGCRYCMMACPFRVPRFKWEESYLGSAVGLIRKCTFCADRIFQGLEPACVQACPTDALMFGERDELLKEARARIAKGGYINHIYGEKEVGGTSVLYLSDVPFEDLGKLYFPKYGSDPIPVLSTRILNQTPSVIALTVLALGGLAWFTKRREEVKKAEGGEM